MAFELQKLTPTHMLHAGRYSALGMDVASQVGLAGSAAAGSAGARPRLAGLAAGHLPESARLSLARVGAAVCRLRPARVPHLLVDARLVHAASTGLRDPRYPEHGDAVRRTARGDRPRDQRQRRRPRHEPAHRRRATGAGPTASRPYVYSQEIYKDTAIYYTDMETGEPRGSRRAGAARRRRRRRRRRPRSR